MKRIIRVQSYVGSGVYELIGIKKFLFFEYMGIIDETKSYEKVEEWVKKYKLDKIWYYLYS
jgi:hypothetical protein